MDFAQFHTIQNKAAKQVNSASFLYIFTHNYIQEGEEIFPRSPEFWQKRDTYCALLENIVALFKEKVKQLKNPTCIEQQNNVSLCAIWFQEN